MIFKKRLFSGLLQTKQWSLLRPLLYHLATNCFSSEKEVKTLANDFMDVTVTRRAIYSSLASIHKRTEQAQF